MPGVTWVAFAPLGTVAVWLFLVVYQVRRERVGTWTEVFLLGACLSVSAYALSDVAFFTAGTADAARDAAVSSLTSLTFTGFFFMVYGAVLRTRFRWSLFLGLVPVGIIVILIPGAILTGVRPVDIGINWLPEYDRAWFGLWAAVLLVFVLTAIASIYLTYREVRRQSVPLARRLMALILCLLLAVALSLATNTAEDLYQLDLVPLLSTALVAPGIVLLFAQSPYAERSLTDILRRSKARDYEVQGAFLLHDNGTLIGSELVPGQNMIDPDVFGATLDVIQNFMRTSFPAFRGKWLQSIRHGDLTLVMERGSWTTVAVVIKGQENDQLRRYLRDRIQSFEADNRAVLEDWRGNASEAVGLNALLGDLVR